MNFEGCNAVIVVLAMPGCPACEEYAPRFERQVRGWQAYNVPFVFASKGASFSPGQIPVLMLDALSKDPQIQGLADSFGVEGLPTTILFRRNAQPEKLEGAIDDQQVYDLLHRAATA